VPTLPLPAPAPQVWYKAAARRASSWGPDHLVLALQALAALGAAPVSGRFTNALLPRLRELLPELAPEELAGALWALASLRVRPEAGWMADFMAGGPAGRRAGGPAGRCRCRCRCCCCCCRRARCAGPAPCLGRTARGAQARAGGTDGL
jgi:hypothetical protein